jgi:oligoendopeptidase F
MEGCVNMIRPIGQVVVSLIVACVLAAGAGAAPGDLADRWNLADLYASPAEWDAAKGAIEQELETLDRCRGKLGDSATVLKECIDDVFRITREFQRLHSYAAMSSDVDIRDQEAMARRQAAGLLATRFSQKIAFGQPELLAVGAETLGRFFKEEAGLSDYLFFVNDTLRQAEHTLSEEGEGVIAAAGDLIGAPGTIYRTLANAEIPWPTITLADGTEVRLDQAGYSKHRGTANRDDRKKVFDAFFGAWKGYERTLGTVLNSAVNANHFRASVRGYAGSLQAALDGNNIPEEVYRTLVFEVNANLDTLHRYLRLRGRLLGVDELRYYDLYPPIVSIDRTFQLAEGKRMVLKALGPLGRDYVGVVALGFKERWMDAYPSAGKRSGAYMNGSVYDVHPYVLLNYNDDYASVSTLAHEWGHVMHSYLAAGAQPYPTYQPSIFTAEIASIFNQALLLEHVLAGTTSDDEQLFYLGRALDSIRVAFFRQTQFAEFELAIHEKVERGEPLTGESLTTIYGDILRRHFGQDEGVVTVDDLYAIEWAFVPHFYRNFYVYQYATSMAAASLLARDVLSGREGSLENYLGLLRAGGSAHPYDLLKRAGVDMATPLPYRATVARMNHIMERIEAILDAREQ